MFEAWKSEWGEPSEARLREKLEAEGYSVARYEYPPGAYFPDDAHPHEKKDAVVSGRFFATAFQSVIFLGDPVYVGNRGGIPRRG